MLVYTKIVGENAPEAFLLSGPDATVGELLGRVRLVRSSIGREVALLDEGPDNSALLTEIGIHHGDMVVLRALGEPVPSFEYLPAKETPSVDVDALRAETVRAPRRISEYEDLTQLLQWNPPYHINGDRPSQKVWSDDSTLLRSGDWSAFRSPDKLYYRTYIGRQAKAEQAVSTAFQFASESGQLSQVDSDHVTLMRDLVGSLQYPDWGLCMLHQHTTRFALSSWIAGATEFMMFDELRHAQLYGRLALAYAEYHDGFDDPQPNWMEAERFQPTRRLVEELLAVLDWGKATILAGIVVEPILTSVAHSLLSTGSVRAGDSLTPFVCQSIAKDKVRHRESASAFLQLVSTDAAYGQDNREQIAQWVAEWLPIVMAASVDLSKGDPIAGEALQKAVRWISEQMDFADGSVGNVLSSAVELGSK